MDSICLDVQVPQLFNMKCRVWTAGFPFSLSEDFGPDPLLAEKYASDFFFPSNTSFFAGGRVIIVSPI